MFFIVFALIPLLCEATGVNSEAGYVAEIFEFENIISYYECEEQSLYFNEAQMLNIPMPGIPSQPITEQNVSFVIYSRQNNNPITINTYDPTKSLINSTIDFKKPVVLFVQGMKVSYKIVVSRFNEFLLSKEDINLIFMDWDSYTYYESMYSRNNTVPRLGTILAKFLRQLIKAGTNEKLIYSIGISSGAHPIGIAGRLIEPRIGKIMGIDPAGACYNFGSNSLRLSQGDADFVQIIHCSEGEYGQIGSILGDATFYMNGGVVQPRCLSEQSLSQVNLCSHISCFEYVVDTFKNPNKYVGFKCNSYEQCLQGEGDTNTKAVMGYYASSKIHGEYYVKTDTNSSGCK